MKMGGAESCRCGDCANFARQKPVPYPKEFMKLLTLLGVDPQREIEVYNQYVLADQEYVDYAGWFYFVDHVQRGDENAMNAGLFNWYVREGQNYKASEFEGNAVSRIEFRDLRLPVIDRSPLYRPNGHKFTSD